MNTYTILLLSTSKGILLQQGLMIFVRIYLFATPNIILRKKFELITNDSKAHTYT